MIWLLLLLLSTTVLLTFICNKQVAQMRKSRDLINDVTETIQDFEAINIEYALLRRTSGYVYHFLANAQPFGSHDVALGEMRELLRYAVNYTRGQDLHDYEGPPPLRPH